MSPSLRPGIYLEDNPPARSQFRVGRRSPVKPVIVVHTAESGPASAAFDVASFIRRRSDAGSYHLLGDADRIIQLVRFENEAFHDATGSNRWAIGISLAINAADWPNMTTVRRDALVETAAQMAAIAGRWLAQRGVGWPDPSRLSKAQSDAVDASGFVAHGDRDPGRRSDPGRGFPWDRFLARYSQLAEGVTAMPDRTDIIAQAQAVIARVGFAHAWWDSDRPWIDPSDTAAVERYADGDFGPQTLADLTDLATEYEALGDGAAERTALARIAAICKEVG